MLQRVVLVLVAGCRFHFDASVDATDVVDGEPDAVPPTGPFGGAMPVGSIDTASAEDDASLTADQLVIFFDSSRTGGLGGGDIWTATRMNIADPWGMPTNVGELNTTGDDATPDISRDGLTIYWVSAGAAGAKDIYYATRPDRSSTWGAGTRVPELSSAADESGPTLTPDGKTIYFSRDPSGTDDLYVATRPSIGATWSMPTAIAALNMTGVADAEPCINGANTFILWSSDRTGNGDLYMARRTDPSSPWSAPAPVTELNTTASEGDPWLSADERTLYFTRGTDVYIATR